jgi:AcrR family transcriptional regulator
VRSRDTVLEAASAVIGEVGFGGVTIAAVATRAGVSRQTVYSIFSSRENLVSQAVSDRLTTLNGAFTDVLESAETPLELLVEIIVQARHRILADPMLRVLTLSGKGNPIFDPGATDRALEYCLGLLAPAVDRFPEMSGRLEFLADIGVHVGWSVLCLDSPTTRSDAELRAFLTSWLGPVLSASQT